MKVKGRKTSGRASCALPEAGQARARARMMSGSFKNGGLNMCFPAVNKWLEAWRFYESKGRKRGLQRTFNCDKGFALPRTPLFF
jgi:hypothetical protein